MSKPYRFLGRMGVTRAGYRNTSTRCNGDLMTKPGQNTSNSPQMSRVYGKRVAGGDLSQAERAEMAQNMDQRPHAPIKLPYVRFLDPAHQKVKA